MQLLVNCSLWRLGDDDMPQEKHRIFEDMAGVHPVGFFERSGLLTFTLRVARTVEPELTYHEAQGRHHSILEFLPPRAHPSRRFIKTIWIEIMTKPWLGAQEVLYQSLLWHLKVPHGYASQVAANRLVFPGESMVNISNPPTTHSAVDLGGYVDSWITDMECATSLRPRLYGFDYGRVADVVEVSLGMADGVERFDKRLITTLPQAQRVGTPSIPSEKAMMKDLMLSAYALGGEICLSYHMLNPFITPAETSAGADPLKYHTGQSNTHLGSGQFQAEFAAQSATVDRGGREMGQFVNDLLSHPMATGKDIYIRLFHEPNISYFWWGEANGATAAPYMDNFIFLWNFMVAAVKNEVDQDKRSRLKFVFCINGKPSVNALEGDLDRYFPTGGANATYTTFLNSIAVLGLDYYEDWQKDPSASLLTDQYARVVAKAAAINTRFGLSWAHALTEVSIRSVAPGQASIGKLYGAFGNSAAWPDGQRSFFKDKVFDLAKQSSPKWVMFWVNRLGNSALSAITPSTSGGASLRYGQTDVFAEGTAEFYYPMLPAEPFYVETYKDGEVDTAGVQQKTFVKVAAANPDLLDQIPGATANGTRTPNGEAYNDAVLDFFTLVPRYIRSWNASGVLAVEAFQRGTLSRPIFSQSPVPPDPNAPDIIFDTL